LTDSPALQKTDFGAIYDQPDPRAYFATLGPFGYTIPQHGADAFSRLLAARQQRPRTVLDLCCSYGIVGTLLRTDLRLDDLYAHYTDPAVASLPAEKLQRVDREWIAEHRRQPTPRVVGLDVAPHAVAYGVEVGAMDAGVTDNLEDEPPSDRLAELLVDVDLITTTGGVGYVTEKTFDRLLRSCRAGVWVASLCLRTYDYAPIAESLASHGLRTERMSHTFRQRRFTNDEERTWAMSRVAERGLDPTGKESTGWYHADLYLSRPETESGPPVDELLAGAF